MKNIVCIIGARGGSKGVPGKNTIPVLGKPLIAWSIEQALQCPLISKVIVSTDSNLIAKVALDHGAEVPFIRPGNLADDKAGKWEVWKHGLLEMEKIYGNKVDLIVDLDCTSPLRDVEDITAAIKQFEKSSVDAIFSICAARKNPYFNMVEYRNDKLEICKKTKKRLVRRQDAPKVYEHVASIYVLDPDFIKTGTGLLSGKARGYEIDPLKSFDVDSPLDLEIVEFLMKRKNEQNI